MHAQTPLLCQVNSIPIELFGSFEKPATSCNRIYHQGSPSGKYWIQPATASAPIQLFCTTDPLNCSCNSTTGWARVANLDMTDPNQNCPDGFRLVSRTEPPLRTCGTASPGCVSTTFAAHGIEYSRVCGRVVGYQYGHTDAFSAYIGRPSTIDGTYVDGISLTHGQSPRQHIWTFAAALDEAESRGSRNSCPCIKPEEPFTTELPPFIGQDYFCDTENAMFNGDPNTSEFYPDDPLWDGQGCGGNSTCCEFNNPPWFCKQLPQTSTNDIELRLCSDEVIDWEGTPFEKVEIYIN